jgi:hypothetical protein
MNRFRWLPGPGASVARYFPDKCSMLSDRLDQQAMRGAGTRVKKRMSPL